MPPPHGLGKAYLFIAALLIAMFADFAMPAAARAQGEWMPDAFVEPIGNYDPCDPGEGFSPLPHSGLCSQFPGYQPTPGYDISGGTVTTLPAGGTLVENVNYLIGGWWELVGTGSVTFRNCNFKMTGNASIQIKNSNSATFEGCNFFSCDYMWGAIVVGNGSHPFTFKGCHIEDAATALGIRTLYITGQKEVTVEDNAFVNNYIGLSSYTLDNINTPHFAALPFFTCAGNNFTTTGNLRPYIAPGPSGSYAYALMVGLNNSNTFVHPQAFTGINLANVGVVIGGGALSTNTFSRTRYGMFLRRSVVTSAYNQFGLIWNTGIYADASQLIVEGDLFDSGATGFTYVNHGILAERTNLTVSYSTFKNKLVWGIRSRKNTNAEVVVIHSNHFEQRGGDCRFGVQLERSAAAPSAQIDPHNRIYGNFCNMEGGGFDGLIQNYSLFGVNGTNTATDKMSIYDNHELEFKNVNKTNSAIALVGSNGDNFRILRNKIDLDGVFAADFYGVNFSEVASVGNRIDANEIRGVATNDPALPYSIDCCIHMASNTAQIDLCENMVDKARHGLHFQNGSDFGVHENKMYDHEYGIRIEFGPEVGYQDARGNQWLGSYTEYAAYKKGPLSIFPEDPINVRFWVSEGTQLPFLPPGSMLFPNPDLEPLENRKWFNYESDLTLDYCDPSQPSAVPPLSPSEMRVAGGISTLSAADLWDARRHLYRKLLEQPNLAPTGSVSKAFMDSYVNTSVAAFAQLDYQFRQATQFATAPQADRDSWASDITARQASIKTLWATANDQPYTLSVTQKNQLSGHWQQAATSFGSQRSADEARSQQLNTALNNAATYNTGLTAANTQEQARKTLNGIQISLALGNPLTQAQYASLLGIAEQSADGVGSAQREAAHLLSPCDRAIYAVHEAHEVGKPLTAPHAPQPVAQMRLAPNPSSGILQVNLPGGASGLIQVSDLSGRKVRTLTVQPNSRMVVLDLSDQPAGIYFLHLFGADGTWLGAGKAVIQP